MLGVVDGGGVGDVGVRSDVVVSGCGVDMVADGVGVVADEMGVVGPCVVAGTSITGTTVGGSKVGAGRTTT